MKKLEWVLSAVFLSILCFQTQSVAEDSLRLITAIKLPYDHDKASIDRYGNLFISDRKGNVNKYNSEGEFQLNFSPQRFGDVAVLEAWNTINIFLFYREFQEYALLDRFMGYHPNFKIERDAVGFARVATLASDFNIWIFDDTDFTLKKYDRRMNKVVFSTPLNLVLDVDEYDIRFIREYQNMLYIADLNTGILVFDNFGNYKKKLPFAAGADFFSFENDLLYFSLPGSGLLTGFDIYKLEIYETPLPEGTSGRPAKVFPAGNRLYVVQGDELKIYERSVNK